ncbi:MULTISPECIES: ABC transporter permease [Blautia]|nr:MULTISPECIES: ABC transporter permease [Blautia]MCU6773221.1 ABC transporter permease [Blautia acetigignens]SCG97010.1 Oligopeptide transport system permease protein oppC [uncultured Blautia sp.]
MSTDSTKKKDNHVSTSKALDDEQRVKILSPGMLVAKRFFRNKLAVAGLVILVTMFIFSFIGGMVSPYGESQVFRKTDHVWKDYAGATYNKSYIFETANGDEFPAQGQQKFILATNKGNDSFEANDVTYGLEQKGEDYWAIYSSESVATVLTLKGKSTYKQVGNTEVTDEIKEGYEEAVANDENTFEVDGITYTIEKAGRENQITISGEVAFATKKVFSAAAKDADLGFQFKQAVLDAIEAGETSFEYDGTKYELNTTEEETSTEVVKDGEVYATISNLLVSPQANGVFLSLSFKEAVEQAIADKATTFTAINEAGEEETYQLQTKNTQYVVRSQKATTVNDTYSAPSKKHWAGTDGNGMDMLTRLMYGGRISLMIGFVVIIIEGIIGILIGGISGYFGGWVDTILMRVVDVVICIPAMPLYIIIGSVMDYYKIDPRIRIYALCAILGIVGWPGIARMVRGQILSLREQEFMVATEATGVRISRRIFRHLIPNVIPQLIVIATMGLGDVILMEATLSFLGIGVKFPYASWGNIVNAVNDVYVLTNFWFVWIPAGFLILLTVLGFNFVGDGLRDAFDPKMKR